MKLHRNSSIYYHGIRRANAISWPEAKQVRVYRELKLALARNKAKRMKRRKAERTARRNNRTK